MYIYVYIYRELYVGMLFINVCIELYMRGNISIYMCVLS